MVDILIETRDQFGEIIREHIKANKIVNKDERVYFYKKDKEEGFIKSSPLQTEISRNGEIVSHLIIKLGEKTDFLYKNPYLNKRFLIECESYKYSEEAVEFSYTLYDKEIVLNRLKVRIFEKRGI